MTTRSGRQYQPAAPAPAKKKIKQESKDAKIPVQTECAHCAVDLKDTGGVGSRCDFCSDAAQLYCSDCLHVCDFCGITACDGCLRVDTCNICGRPCCDSESHAGCSRTCDNCHTINVCARCVRDCRQCLSTDKPEASPLCPSCYAEEPVGLCKNCEPQTPEKK